MLQFGSKYRILMPLVLIINFSVYCLAIRCFRCDSVSLPACALTLNETHDLPQEEHKTSSTCVITIVDSVIYRGCSYNTPIGGAAYETHCWDTLCNKGVFPPGRLKCHHCNGNDKNCAAQQLDKPRPCRYHYENDQCYTDVATINEVYRGCKSDTNHTISNKATYCAFNGCNEVAFTANAIN